MGESWSKTWFSKFLKKLSLLSKYIFSTLQPVSFSIRSIFFFSLYLSSLSIIEKHLIFLLNFFIAIETNAEESIPQLRQNAKGTSDLNLKFKDFSNKNFTL